MAYVGAPSRAIFPVDTGFAQKSNNTAAFMRGEALLIGDVHAHIAAGGAYYECDAKVRSELCLPLLGYERSPGGLDYERSRGGLDGGRRLGLIDCESFTPGYFTPALSARVLLIGEWLIGAGLLSARDPVAGVDRR